MEPTKRDFLTIRDLRNQDLKFLLKRAGTVKQTPDRFAYAWKGKVMAMLFEKPSLRTRVSFETGMVQLGGHAIYLAPSDISMGTRETVPDVARNLERMVDVIMARVFAHETVEELAAHARVPVINGLSDFTHPCQAIADLFTVQECKGALAGQRLAWVGDGNNVCHSLLFAGARTGMDVVAVHPPGYDPDPDVVTMAAELAAETGGSITATSDLEGVADADVVYTDVWASMGQEAEQAERLELFAEYQVNAALMGRAKPDAVFMHCLPAHRGEEVAAEVIDSDRSVVFQQAENRLHAQKALLLWIRDLET